MGEVLDRFREAGGRGALPDGNFLAGGNREEIYTEIYAGLITPRSIGANLFTGAQYEGYQQNEGERELTLWVASEGSFSLVSNIHFQAENEYLFDRVKLVQGDLKVRLTKDFHRRLGHGPEAGRSRGTAVLFRLPPDAGLDPLAPFDVVLMIAGKDADGSPMTIEVPMAYQLPERHMLPPPPVPLWVQTWREKQVDIAILGLLLVAVTIIFLFQDFLDPLSPDLHPGPGCNPCLRSGLVGLVRGGGQLSIANILAYIQSPFGGTGIGAFALDPLIFILSVYAAVTLFVLGRGRVLWLAVPVRRRPGTAEPTGAASTYSTNQRARNTSTTAVGCQIPGDDLSDRCGVRFGGCGGEIRRNRALPRRNHRAF